jgi:hypothetical protein
MSVCLLYSSEFFDLRRNRVFDGYTCPDSKRVFSIGNVNSNTRCFLYCKNSSSYVDIFYQPQKRRCDGCIYFVDTELEIEDGSLHYTRRGKYYYHIFLINSCFTLPNPWSRVKLIILPEFNYILVI